MKAIVTVAVLGAGAYALVYASGVSELGLLRGRVLATAFLGGWALAFTRPLLLLVLVPFTTVIWLRARGPRPSTPRWPWLPPALFLAGLSLAFVVTISGAPDLVAQPIYRAHDLIELGAGGLLVVWGALIALRIPALQARSGWWAAGVGVATGLLVYHELDPSYDSVFFATGNAVASSHAPLTVVAFVTALSVLYLAGAVEAARWDVPFGRMLAGAATAVVGAAVAGGWFPMVNATLLR